MKANVSRMVLLGLMTLLPLDPGTRLTARAAGPEVEGQWSFPMMDWGEMSPMHMIVLKTGEVLAIDFPQPQHSYAHCLLFDPVTEMVTYEFEGPAIFGLTLLCAGPVALADGKIFFHGALTANKLATLYDPDAPPGPASWTSQDPGPAKRFYPTCTLLGDGTVLVTAGMQGSSPGPNTPAIFDPNQPPGQQWRSLTEAEYCTHDLDCQTNNFHLHTYPFMYLLSTGQRAGEVGFTGAEVLSTPGTRTLNTQSEGAWTEVIPEVDDPIQGGSAVLYGPDLIMKAGGDDAGDVTAKVFTLDLAATDPAWTAQNDMKKPRKDHLYLIVLPDGKILATNGQNNGGDVLEPELYDPGVPNAEWELMAPMDGGRAHHASAVLLPDARVLVAGTDNNPPNTAQIFSPPYLFQGARPTITAVGPETDTMCYGKTASVTTPDANQVTAVSLIRPGSSTHGIDFDQRFTNLIFSVAASDELSVTAPATSNHAPPGYYMLFILVDDPPSAVPSIAKMVLLTTCGACCTGGGSCIDRSEAGCAAAGGTFGGSGTVCTAEEDLARCCLPDGSCVDDMSEVCCELLGGIWKFLGITECGSFCPAIFGPQPEP